MVAMENPTCIARLVQFKVVAVAMQPRFHYIWHLNEVTIVRKRSRLRSGTSVQNGRACRIVCVSFNRTTAVMKVSDE